MPLWLLKRPTQRHGITQHPSLAVEAPHEDETRVVCRAEQSKLSNKEIVAERAREKRSARVQGLMGTRPAGSDRLNGSPPF